MLSAFMALGPNARSRIRARKLFPEPVQQTDTTKTDTTKVNLKYPFRDRYADPFSSQQKESPFFLKDPSNIKRTIEYNPETGNYEVVEKIGEHYFRPPSEVRFQDFVNKEFDKQERNYWKQRTNETSLINKKALIPKLHVGGEAFDRIFGGNTVDIRPQGTAELIFAGNISSNQNPALTLRQRTISTFDFKEKIQMNVIGNIGEKLKLTTNYNTEATFDFENQMKLDYTGYEDEIIKKIEAGNVNFPLPTSLIQGSQSLFGVKTQLQFGRLMVTSIFSQKRGKSSTVEVNGGAQTTNFTIQGDNYEANKHFFLSQYFRDNYDQALSKLPVVNSRITITKVEAWITNTSYTPENTRGVIAFLDLGEPRPDGGNGFVTATGGQNLPDNKANNLYTKIITQSVYDSLRSLNQSSNILASTTLQNAYDYERLNARRLNPNEFTVNTRLGYISLNTPLNPNQVLAVAYQYTIVGETGTHQVGEFSTDGINPPNMLFLKLLKSSVTHTRTPLWDLMMKNIYSLGGGYQINSKDFRLDIYYNNPATGTPLQYLPEGPASVKGVRLLKVMNLDNVNTQNLPQPDGLFDFIDGVTINAQNGRIIFPSVEPFGKFLKSKFPSGDPLAARYAFDSLYTATKAAAIQDAFHNRYVIKGSYQSSMSSDISLNAPNIPQGSVSVTSGGIKLVENVDYTVDYTLGRVKIINEGYLNSGTPIKINLESNALFNIQTKSLMGSRFDYTFSKNFTVGGTIMNLTERPLTQKVNIGDEPISNTIWGLDGTYRTESRFITKMIDKLPFIDTKEISTLTVSGEFAQLIPGHSSAIGASGTSYIDDFEGSKTPIDLKTPSSWYLASTPQNQLSLFPETRFSQNALEYGYNRAKLSWFVIDPLFLRDDNTLKPSYINKDMQSDPRVMEVRETDIFPNKQPANGVQQSLAVLNLAYYPEERGPYNFDVGGVAGISAGIDNKGKLKSPASRWAGIMRRVETNDFEAANVQNIEFWIMDPFIKDSLTAKGGQLYFNLGSISEDILRDGRTLQENGLPRPGADNLYDVTPWGRVPKVPPPVNAFDNDPNVRTAQDVGYDGLSTVTERSFYKADYLDKIAATYGTNSEAYSIALTDPAADDYHYFRGTDYDNQQLGIIDRYKLFNNVEGNSPVSTGDVSTSATNMPDAEDINRDNNMATSENYFQYKVDLVPSRMRMGQNYITDVVEATHTLANGKKMKVKWYQFKIPIQEPDKVVGSIQDFRSIQFMRMFLKNFDKPILVRFAKLQLIRGEWRKYVGPLRDPGEYNPTDDDNSTFDLNTVNLEENGNRTPIPYVIPNGIQRQVDLATTNLRKLNEQSLALRVCNLPDGESRAAFKNVQYDVRNYKKLRMFVHLEAMDKENLRKGEVSAFIRLGTDFTENYYEYEIPLTPTPAGSSSADAVWPVSNELELDFSKLQNAKETRNAAMLVPGSNVSLTRISPPIKDGDNTIYIKGSPNLANVKTIMIGVRNPRKVFNNDADDGLSKCVEVWVNELRLTDFDEMGGWAANARVAAKLADLGMITAAGSKSTPGFGTIEQKINERSRQDNMQYDISSNLELGKFFPSKAGLRIPMYVGYSEATSTPLWNPIDPDIRLKNSLENSKKNEALHDSIFRSTVDYTMRKSINFTNVKKDRVQTTAKPKVYDVENFAVTYAYTEMFKRNFATKSNLTKTYKAALSYNFQVTPKPVTPFQNIAALNKYKSLRLIKDFNFNYSPSSFSFRTDLDRQYNATALRSFSEGTFIPIEPTYTKIFNIVRTYDLKYDITKSLKADFTANNNSRIDETVGPIDKQAIMDTLKKFNYLGRTALYHHTANVNYNLPLNKIPLLEWVNLSTRYTVNYDWTAAPLKADTLGNMIQNSNSIQYTGQFSMSSLYNKIPLFKKILQKPKTPPKKTDPKIALPKDPKARKAAQDSLKKERELNPILEYIGKGIMTFKTASFTYSETNGTMLPGFTPRSQLIGTSPNNEWAPGIPFVFGSQADIRETAAEKGWLTKNPFLSNQFTKTHMSNFSGRATIEPIQSLRVELTANRNFSKNAQEYFLYDTLTNGFRSFNPNETGNFSISFISLNSSFVSDKADYSNAAFEQFKRNRATIADRLAAANPNSAGQVKGYSYGYGPNSQEVLIPAFLAAYGGVSSSKVNLQTFPTIPKPNWRITYDGLSKYEWAKKYFTNITIGHGYKSTFNIGSYITDLNYGEDNVYHRPNRLNTNQNFISRYTIAQVSIAEQFSPLMSVDITWKNSLSTRFELRKDRTLSMSFANNQLTEIKGTEYVIGAGYRIKELKNPIKLFGQQMKLKNDINLKADLSIRNNYTVIRSLDQGTNSPTAGSLVVTIKTSVDYVINERFSIRLFYDRIMTTPVVSSSFPTANTNFGLSVRFTLAQ